MSFFKVNTHNFWGLGYVSGCAGRAYSLDHQKEESLFADLDAESCKFLRLPFTSLYYEYTSGCVGRAYSLLDPQKEVVLV